MQYDVTAFKTQYQKQELRGSKKVNNFRKISWLQFQKQYVFSKPEGPGKMIFSNEWIEPTHGNLMLRELIINHSATLRQT